MKRILCMVICILLGLSVLGCSEEKQGTRMNIYYVNPEGNGLVEETYYRKIETGEEAIKEVLSVLQNPVDISTVRSAIPENVKVEAMYMKSDTLELVFAESYAELRASAEILLRAAVVQSLVQLPNIRYVTFYIGGVELVNHMGESVGRMSADSFVQNTGSTLKTYQTIDLKMYYPNEDGTRLVADNLNHVHYNINTSIEKLVVENLMKKNVVPSTVQLIGVSVKDDICYVNFNATFLTETGAYKPEIIVFSIVDSILANGKISKVQILVDGSSDVKYKGLLDLSKPFSWNAEVLGG